MFIRSTLSFVLIFAALEPWFLARASEEVDEGAIHSSLPFSNRTNKVLKKLGIEDLETLKKVYAESGRRKFTNVSGLGGKGLKEIEDAMSGLWSEDPESTPLAELGLSSRTITALQAQEPVKNLRDLRALYQKYGRRLTTFDHFGESNLKEVRDILKIKDLADENASDDNQNLAEIGLSNRVTNALWYKGLRTLGDLKQQYAILGQKMRDIPGLGPKGLREVEEFLGVPPAVDLEPKLTPRTKGRLNQLEIGRVEDLKDKSLFWFEKNFREKGIRELLGVLKEQYGITPYKNDLERAIQLKDWQASLESDSMNVSAKSLKFLGFMTVGDLYQGYKNGTPEFRRYEREHDLDIRAKLDAAEKPCEKKL